MTVRTFRIQTSLALVTGIGHYDEFVKHTNKNRALYWLSDNIHIRFVIIVMKSWPSAVICSFQDFVQKKI